ncbi:glycoside hydrolase superfamily [Polychytrium aggregatum]|uniref:glycoside hydrolase superfamily n=1 Tax=Polychytrium aggregatum TaxID=110093 RepID=UPI0022FDB58F|nr:glycoside hydrolase superfamily [Polychytrium aggregatum]KAI9206401.1 glycoside hydrolase superfamily [Polychytrium aggregatum]
MFFSKTAAASALLLASGSLAAAQTCSTDGMYCTAAGSSPNYTWCASGAVYNFACSAGTVCIQSGSSVYCGFSTYGEKSLQATCAENNYDVIVVAFLDTFGHGQVPQVHLDHPFNETTVGIQYCQSTGTAVILSAGGANAGGSSLSSSSDASNFATQLWNTFLGGNINDPTRPFGTAVFDGFDLDIENGANGYYPDFVNTYRSLAPKGSYYLTAAPQCFYPDASLGSTLSSVGGQFDWVSVQFYNNWCSADNYQAGDISNINARFNYDQWDQLAAQEGFDLALGLAASTVAASSGYVAPAGVANIVKEIRATSGASSRFAGVMFWSTAHADNNNNFGGAIKTILQS